MDRDRTGSYTGKNNPAMVTVNCAITEKANWTAQYLVTFKQYGLGNSAGTNTVLTVGSTMYDYKDLPAGIWVTGGTTFRWSSPVSGGAGKQFKLTGSSGLASPILSPRNGHWKLPDAVPAHHGHQPRFRRPSVRVLVQRRFSCDHHSHVSFGDSP